MKITLTGHSAAERLWQLQCVERTIAEHPDRPLSVGRRHAVVWNNPACDWPAVAIYRTYTAWIARRATA